MTVNTSALGYSYLTAPAPAPRASCTTRTARQECINTRPNVELGVSSKLTHKYQHPDFPNGPRSRVLHLRRYKKLHFPQGASRTRIQEEGTIGPKLYTATTSERVSKMPPRFRINRLFEQGRPSSDGSKSVQTRPIREWLVPTGPQDVEKTASTSHVSGLHYTKRYNSKTANTRLAVNSKLWVYKTRGSGMTPWNFRAADGFRYTQGQLV